MGIEDVGVVPAADRPLHRGRTSEPMIYRPVQPADRERLMAFHESLSEESVYRRFHGLLPHLTPAAAASFTTAGTGGRHAWAAFAPGADSTDQALVAVARAEPSSAGAEVAVVVTDAWQGQGVARRLLGFLAADLCREGRQRVYLDVQVDNVRMLALVPSEARLCTLPPEEGCLRIYVDPRVWRRALARGAGP